MKIIIKVFIAFCYFVGYTSLYAQNNSHLKSLQKDSSVFSSPFIQEQPKFFEDVKEYLADSIRYPEEAKEKNIQGTVYVSFVVERNGMVSSVKVLRSDNISLSNEAIRVVSAMPKWKPGRQNGVPQRIRYTLAVPFKL